MMAVPFAHMTFVKTAGKQSKHNLTRGYRCRNGYFNFAIKAAEKKICEEIRVRKTVNSSQARLWRRSEWAFSGCHILKWVSSGGYAGCLQREEYPIRLCKRNSITSDIGGISDLISGKLKTKLNRSIEILWLTLEIRILNGD